MAVGDGLSHIVHLLTGQAGAIERDVGSHGRTLSSLMVGEEVVVKQPGISVVIPCYRTPGTLDRVCCELVDHVGPLTDDLELVLVDDGSPDDTWERITEVVEANDWSAGCDSRATTASTTHLAGLRAASNPVVITTTTTSRIRR